MKKILFLASIYPFLDGFELNNIKLCLKCGYKVYTVANGNDTSTNISYNTDNLDELDIVKYNVEIQRSPFSIDNIDAYREIKKIILREKIDIIDCHTPIGGVLGRLLGKSANCTVIYTAHGFHFYKGAPLINWIIYYPIERILAKLTDILITINEEDFFQSNKFKLKKDGICKYIPGIGIDYEKIKLISARREELLNELKLENDSILLISIGELNENKNHISVIKALPKLNNKIHYIICGQGNLKDEYINIATELGVEKKVHLLGFRKDVIDLIKSSNMFVFPSKREGLSVALMEAIACGTPCIASRIRGNTDLLNNLKNNFLVNTSNFTLDLISIVNSIDFHCFETNEYEISNRISKFDKVNISIEMLSVYRELIK